MYKKKLSLVLFPFSTESGFKAQKEIHEHRQKR